MSLWVVYGLRCPVSRKIRYVGSTRQMLSARLSSHLKDYRRSVSLLMSPKNQWIRALREKELKPTIEILEVCSSQASALASENRFVLTLPDFLNARHVLPVEQEKYPLLGIEADSSS